MNALWFMRSGCCIVLDVQQLQRAVVCGAA